MLIINNRFLSLYDYNFLLVIEKIRKRNSKICGSRIPNVNRFVFTRNSLSNGLLIQINVVNLRSEKRKTVFGFKLMPVDVWKLHLCGSEEEFEEKRKSHLVPVCYIPRVETKERECWKFLDWRLNSENDSRVIG